MSITAWHKQQNFSHSHEASGISHWAHLQRAGPVPVLMRLIYRGLPARGKWLR